MGIISHNRSMVKVRSSDVFDKWIAKLRDHQARQRIIARVKRLAEGNPGDVKPVGRVSLNCASITALATGSTIRIPAAKSLFCFAEAIKLPSKQILLVPKK